MASTPPLPSGAPDPAEAPSDPALAEEGDAEEAPEGPTPAPAAPPLPGFKFSTFLFTFLFILGIWMIIDTSTRVAVAGTIIGAAFWPLSQIVGGHPIVTMLIVGVIEMLITAVAYNWATDWVKAAKVQKWSGAFRKVQMAALRSGKKDRVAALQPHQARLTALSSEVSIAQLKGMAITWFLVISMYTWIWLFLFGWPAGCVTGCHDLAASINTVNLGNAQHPALVKLTGNVGPVPFWFILFTFYTVPYSLLFRRILKHVYLRRHAALASAPVRALEAPGGSA